MTSQNLQNKDELYKEFGFDKSIRGQRVCFLNYVNIFVKTIAFDLTNLQILNANNKLFKVLGSHLTKLNFFFKSSFLYQK